MLYGELNFYNGDTVVKTVDEEEFSEFNAQQLDEYVKAVVKEVRADKCVSSCIYHGGASGTIDTVLFPAAEDNG